MNEVKTTTTKTTRMPKNSFDDVRYDILQSSFRSVPWSVPFRIERQSKPPTKEQLEGTQGITSHIQLYVLLMYTN